jgi:hypothetical protein
MNMTSTTLPSRHDTSASTHSVIGAARGVLGAIQQLLAAIGETMALPRGKSRDALTPAEHAASVRRLAMQYQEQDRGFAADLFAAADRFERQHGL